MNTQGGKNLGCAERKNGEVKRKDVPPPLPPMDRRTVRICKEQ